MTITIGADPEVFVSERGMIGAAIGKIGGTKEKPIRVDGGALQEDNVLAEFNIDPAQSVDEFISRIQAVMSTLTEVVGDVVIQSSHKYEKDLLKSYGRQALEFGCDPDFNAWTEQIKDPPSPYTVMRTAGGHVHIGYPDPEEASNVSIIKLCDLFLSVPSVVMEPHCQRRLMYGGAGSMRHKPYGVEYRTPSNFWLRDTDLMEWTYNACVEAVHNKDSVDQFVDEAGGPEFIQWVINNNQVGEAKAICNNLGLSYA